MDDKSAAMGVLVNKVEGLVELKKELETALRGLVRALERNPEAFPYPEFLMAKEVLNRA